MMGSLYLLIFLTVCAGFAGWMLFLWAAKSGQFDDVEGPKYRMLDDDEEQEENKTIEEERPKIGKKTKDKDNSSCLMNL